MNHLHWMSDCRSPVVTKNLTSTTFHHTQQHFIVCAGHHEQSEASRSHSVRQAQATSAEFQPSRSCRNIATCCSQAFMWFAAFVYLRMVCRWRTLAQAQAAADAEHAQLCKTLAALCHEDTAQLSSAIIVFNYEKHCKNMLLDHHRIPLPMADWIKPSRVRRFHRVTGALGVAMQCVLAALSV